MDAIRELEPQDASKVGSSAASPVRTFATRLGQLPVTIAPRYFYNRYKAGLTDDRSLRRLEIPGTERSPALEAAYQPLRLAPCEPSKLMGEDVDAESESTMMRALERPNVDGAIGIQDALLRSSRIVVLGAPRSGKSTFFRHLALMVLQEKLTTRYVCRLTLTHQDHAMESLVPIVVSLPELAQSGMGMMAFLTQVFAEHGFPHAGSFLEQRLSVGQCLLLLDGLDAVDGERERGEVLEGIASLTDRYGKRNQILVSSRSVGYHGELSDFEHFELLPLGENAIEGFIEYWFADQPGKAQRFLATLEASPGMRSMASNPYLLSVLAVAGERGDGVGLRSVDLCDTSVDILLGESERDRSRAYARRLAYQAHIEGDYSFSLQEMSSFFQEAAPDAVGRSDDLENVLATEVKQTDLLWPVSEDRYGFAHPMLQNYLVAEEVLEQEAASALVDRVDDVRWREVIPLVAGLQGDATGMIRRIVARSDEVGDHALLLAAECLQEADRTDRNLREEIRAALFDTFEQDDPALWRGAAVALAGIEGRSMRDTFTSYLRNGHPELRVQAARALGCIGEVWGVTALIAALGDEVTDVRRTAAWALGEIGDDRAVYSLVKLLGDEDEGVRREAAAALGAIGEPALRPLIGALGDRSDRVSARAAAALGRLGPAAIPALLTALDSEREGTREGAVEALADIGQPAIGRLVDALDSESPQIRSGAIEALGRIDDQESLSHIVAALADSERVVRREARETLKRTGRRAVDPLVLALIDDDRWVSGGAEDLLAELGDPAVDGLFEAVRGERRAIRWAAANVLGRIGRDEPSVVSELGEVLKDERSEVRHTAVRVLGQIGSDDAIKVLTRELDAQDEELRDKAAQALVTLGNDTVVQEMRQAFNRGLEPRRIIELVSRIETRSARDFLRELLQSDDRNIRNMAAFALEADEKSGLYYYRAWEPTIEERLFMRGSVTTAMLSGIPSDLRPLVLQRYMSSHPQADLSYDAEMAILHLNAISRYKKVFEGWDRAVQNLDGRSDLSEQMFAECVESLVDELCEVLGVTLIKTEVNRRLHCFVLKVPSVTRGTNLPQEIPLVFLRRKVLTEDDLDNLRKLFGKIKVFHKTALLVLFGKGKPVAQARQLVDEKLREVHAFDVIVLGKKEIQHVVIAKNPPDALRFTICEQADLTLVSPYSCDEPASRSLFFGREFEIRAATQAIANSSVAILGGRRIGKTSILHRVNEVLCETHPCRYLDCHPIRDYDILFRTMAYHWPEVGSLAPEPVSFHSVVNELRDDRTLVFIFDEIDALLRFDIGNDELLFKTFRSLSQEGQCRFIFSGERVLSNQLKYGSKSPLFNFCGQRVQLGYLERKSARQLITEPMSWMNIELRDRERVIEGILDLSSCHPRLVQYLCHNLIVQINREEVRFITPEQVERIADSNDFREEYLYTVWGDATSFERALTLALEKPIVTHDEIQEALRRWEVPYTWEGLKAALHNLKTCSVLEQDNSTFHFVAEHFPRIARESLDIEMEISSLRRKIRREQDL